MNQDLAHGEEPDEEPEITESLEENLLRDERLDLTEDVLESVEQGLPYVPPHEPPVLPGGRDDARVAQAGVDGEELMDDILDALAANPATADLKLEVEVHGGHVVLTGEVDDPADAEAAVGTVLAVAGVDEVTDRIWLIR